MTIFKWLQESMVRLRDAGVDSPRRDCLVLIEDLLERDRAWVLANHDKQLNEKQQFTLNTKLKRREKREPLAYIRGKAWFYGRFFEVSSSVMVPRPETESFVDIIKELDSKNPINTAWDIGTGSGSIAITIKKELSDVHVSACDKSELALKIARANAKKHGENVRFIKSDLLTNMPGMPSTRNYIITANLPYVPTQLNVEKELEFEPDAALYSGSDGLDHYRAFWKQVAGLKNKPSYILIESLETQHANMKSLAKAAGFHHHKTEVLVQVFSR
jgi:release factor glutamine methyltransferase